MTVSAHTVSHGDAFIARRLVQGAVARQDVDDITQEVLCVLAFHREPIHVPEGRTPAQAREAFLWRAALWKLSEHGRHQARLRAGDGLGAEVLSPRATPSAEALSLAFAPVATLRRALAQLQEAEPALYAVLDLAADGAPMRAAAAALEIPEGTACSRLRRARAAVRAFFEAEEAKGAKRARREAANRARGRCFAGGVA